MVGDMDDAAAVVRRSGAATVAVLPSPEMDGVKLRPLPGSWKRPERTCMLRPPCSTWRGPEPRSGRPLA